MLTTTERLRESLLTTHRGVPESHITTITNGFDSNISAEERASGAPHDKTVFLHTGELYRGRRIDTLCSALTTVLKKGAFGTKLPKVVFIGETDPEIERMARALEMFIVEGIFTTIPLHRKILADPDFRAGRVDTTFIERFFAVRKEESAD